MSLIRLAWKNIAYSTFRSSIIFLCAALMAGVAVAVTVVMGGAQQSLTLALRRLGADIIVVPNGTVARVENAFLMGVPAVSWMPQSNLEVVARVPGVAAASPQIFLSTLRGATCCSLPEMFLIAYDPATDFALSPWLKTHHYEGLALGEAVGGSLVYVPEGDEFISIYGYEVDLVGKLAPTGAGLDQSMFLTFETAYEIARLSPEQAEQVLEIPEGSISSILVRVSLDADPAAVAAEIKRLLPETTPVESAGLFRSQREVMAGLLRSLVVLVALVWVLAILLTALVSTVSVNARRRQIGVLRALGATEKMVLRALVAETALLATMGGVFGVGLFSLSVYLFHNLLVDSLAIPFLFPSPTSLALLALGGTGLTVVGITGSGLLSVLHISRQEPAAVMRD